MKNTTLRDVFRDKYSTQLFLVLYLSLDTPPHTVFSVQTRGSALSNIRSYARTYIIRILKFQTLCVATHALSLQIQSHNYM